MLKLFSYLKKYQLSLLFCFLLLFTQAICDLSLPNLMSDIINVGIAQKDINYIMTKGFFMIIITLISVVTSLFVGFMASKIASGSAKTLRELMFKKVENFSHNEIDNFSTSSLITRTTNDINQIQTMGMTAIRMVCYAPILGIGGIVMAVSKSSRMNWTIILNVVILLVLVGTIFLIAMPKFNIVQKLVDKLNLISRENLNGIMVIRAFASEKFEEKRFDKANIDLTKTNRFINNVMSFLSPTMMFIMNASGVLILYVGSYRVLDGSMQIGDVIALMQYSIQIIISFLFVSVVFILFPRAEVSAKRITEVLETKETIKDPIKCYKISDINNCEITFEDVSFKYLNAEDNVLENISFTAKPGQTTAFIGSTGSGKSTLINLIPRFYDATSGTIKINGIDIKTVSQKELRNLIGYIPQKGVLFSGTVASNLRYGDESADENDLTQVIDISQASEFVTKMEDGLNSTISQGGTNISGGQKQRLSIARALVKRAPIYLFDDSFSALDFKTDAELRNALKKYTSKSTVLIVAQRISTIMNAEQIIVLNKGKIVGMGTHNELLKQCPIYYEIAESQLSKEVL